MKYKPVFLLIILLVSHNAHVLSAQTLVDHKIQWLSLSKTEHCPVIDGKLDDACWKYAVLIDDFKVKSDEVITTAKEKTECFLTYDDTHIYVAFICHDSNMQGLKDDSKIWDDPDILLDDRVQIFIDANHDHRSYYEFAVNPSGVQFDRKGFMRYPNTRTSDWDTGWNCFWKARTQIKPDQWIAEIAIDVSTCGVEKLIKGMTFGFNATRVRQPDFTEDEWGRIKTPAENNENSAWAPMSDGLWETLSNFYEPIQFGDLVFDVTEIKVQNLKFRSAKFNWGDVFTTSTYGWNPLEIEMISSHEESGDIQVDLTVEPENEATWCAQQSCHIETEQAVQTQYFIPENRENKLTIQLSDAKTNEALYSVSYILTTPAFVEFDLEPLFMRSPEKIKPIRFRTLTDDITRKKNALHLKLFKQNNPDVIAEVHLSDIMQTNIMTPVFDIDALRRLPGGDYAIDCQLVERTTGEITGTFQQNFTKFDPNVTETFRVIEGPYSFSGISDDAIRIQYPNGAEYVFWRAANYNPWWDIDQAILNYEHLETWGEGYVQGCCEVMQDREKRYSRVELIENSPARVVVRWQYALADAHYNIHMNEWGDEYYRFYPDGVGIREVNLWANSTKRHEFFEMLTVKPGGVQSLQQYDQPIASMKTLEGIGYTTDEFWNHDTDFYYDFINTSNDFVVEFNMKDRLHPYAIFSLRDNLLPGVEMHSVNVCSPARSLDKGDERGHWPSSLYPIDGYNSIGTDRPRHGNIGSIHIETVDDENKNNKWCVLVGVDRENGETKFQHGQSWLYPAEIQGLTNDIKFKAYDYFQRAYILSMEPDIKTCELLLKSESEILNPVFIFNQEKQIESVLLGKEIMPIQKFKTGVTIQGETLVFLEAYCEKNQRIQFNFK